jgi:hypothetical protein
LLRFYLECLKKYAGLCSNATNEILGCHVRFASLMAQRIDGASESQNNLRYDYSETTRLANGISAAADELSTYVTKTIDNLNSFVSVLEEVQVTVKKGSLVESVKNILRWIWGWLKYLAEAIARIPSAKPRGEIPLSTLEEGAARYCPADSGAFLEHNPPPARSEVIDSLMQDPRRGKSLRGWSPQFYSSKGLFPRKHGTPKRI